MLLWDCGTRSIVSVTFLVLGCSACRVTLILFHLLLRVDALFDGLFGADGTLQAEEHVKPIFYSGLIMPTYWCPSSKVLLPLTRCIWNQEFRGSPEFSNKGRLKIFYHTHRLWFRALAVLVHGIAALLPTLLAGTTVVHGQIIPARAVRDRNPLSLVVLLHLGECLKLLLDDGAGDGGLLTPGVHLIQEGDGYNRHQQNRLHGEALTVLDKKQLSLMAFNTRKYENTDADFTNKRMRSKLIRLYENFMIWIESFYQIIWLKGWNFTNSKSINLFMQINSTWSDSTCACLIGMGIRRRRSEGGRIIARIRGNWWLCVRLSIVSGNKVTNINTQLCFHMADSLPELR